MDNVLSVILGLLFLYVAFIAPFCYSAYICRSRNRSVLKGLFVTLFFGWFATIGLWLGLKTRSQDSKLLY